MAKEQTAARQYRSAIFIANDEQRKAAEAKITALNHGKGLFKPIVTTLEPLTEFYPASSIIKITPAITPCRHISRRKQFPKRVRSAISIPR